jgi:hypothetical protein
MTGDEPADSACLVQVHARGTASLLVPIIPKWHKQAVRATLSAQGSVDRLKPDEAAHLLSVSKLRYRHFPR